MPVRQIHIVKVTIRLTILFQELNIVNQKVHSNTFSDDDDCIGVVAKAENYLSPSPPSERRPLFYDDAVVTEGPHFTLCWCTTLLLHLLFSRERVRYYKRRRNGYKESPHTFEKNTHTHTHKIIDNGTFAISGNSPTHPADG